MNPFSFLDHEKLTSVVGGDGGDTGEGHPSLFHLTLLVFEAVMEVVCVSLPGYVVARCGMFNTEHQKFVANLNVSLFTPCLIFTKLASQLTLSKIAELAVIPVIFVFMTVVSYSCSLAVAKALRLEKRARNFVIAMGVFGNSNSLPISLVMSLANTISGLHWDMIPGDNDEEVAARGILYLLIFQQLGQLLRWSWGYHVLLAPPSPNEDENDDNEVTPPNTRYRDNVSEDVEAQPRNRPFMTPKFENSLQGFFQSTTDDTPETEPLLYNREQNHQRDYTSGTSDSAFESGPSGDVTPLGGCPSSPSFTKDLDNTRSPSPAPPPRSSTTLAVPLQGNRGVRDIAEIERVVNAATERSTGPENRTWIRWIYSVILRFGMGLWEFMNPPLWAMFAAVVVASIPKLQQLFFTPGTFLNASVTRAVSQSGNVAVPLILVVLGANLANSTTKSTHCNREKYETKLLVASLISRMLLPLVFIAPVLAFAAKYLSISILDDPIFVVVCFLLTGAPSALQLAQICQINNVYEDLITRILFWSYVVVILPSTLVLVIAAIEVVHWAM